MAGRSTDGQHGAKSDTGGTDGRRFSYWLALVLRTEREHAAIDRDDLATLLGVSDNTLKRLELGNSLGRDTDQYVAGYAYAIGLDDSRDLWAQAIKRWRDAGADPAIKPEWTPSSVAAAAFARAIRETAQRARRSHGGPTGTRSATPRKDRAG